MPVPEGTKKSELDIETLKNIAIAAAEQVYEYKLIAKAVNRNEDTLLKWRTNDEQFSDKLARARHRFVEKHTKRSKPEFLLERLVPEFKQNTNTNINIVMPQPLLGGETRKVIDVEQSREIDSGA